MLVKDKIKAYLFLVLFSFLSFVIWRFEIEYHGWHGLIWLSYFQLTIPISFLLFIIWVNSSFRFGSKRRQLILNLMLLLWIVLGFFSFTSALGYFFVTGPSAMLYFAIPNWKLYILYFNTFIIAPLFPLISMSSLRFVGVKIPVYYIFSSLFLFLLAFPIATFLLTIIPQKGSPDFIHAVKTGFVFPLLFFSLGFPLIYSRTMAPQNKKKEDPNILDDISLP